MPKLIAENKKLGVYLYAHYQGTNKGYIHLSYANSAYGHNWNFSTYPRQHFWQIWRAKYTVREAIRLAMMAYEEMCNKLEEREIVIKETVEETKEMTKEINQILKAI